MRPDVGGQDPSTGGCIDLERAAGNDPASLAWKARAQPLDQARKTGADEDTRNPAIQLGKLMSHLGTPAYSVRRSPPVSSLACRPGFRAGGFTSPEHLAPPAGVEPARIDVRSVNSVHRRRYKLVDSLGIEPSGPKHRGYSPGALHMRLAIHW